MQTSRLFEIMYILSDKDNKITTAGKLAKHFEVSTRTIYRDIETLCTAGIPIYTEKGKGGGIRLLEGYVFDKSIMTDEEKKYLLSGLQAVAMVRSDSNEKMLNKLESMLGGNSDNWIEIDFGNWKDAERERKLFEQLKSSIINKYCVSFDYTGLRGKYERRYVEPLRLVFRSMSWYVYAFCRQRQDYRFFKLSRIQNCMDSRESFDRVVGNVISGEAKKETKADGVCLKLKVKAKAAYRIYDEFRDYETLENGDVIACWEAYNEESICEYILSFGDSVTVLEPESVRKEIAAMAEKIYKQHI